MLSSAAASGERRIATPCDGSKEPKTKISTVFPFAGFTTLTLSPGRYPTVFPNKPEGSSPFSATTALPSTEGLKPVNKRPERMKIPAKINIFFIQPLTYLTPFLFLLPSL